MLLVLTVLVKVVISDPNEAEDVVLFVLSAVEEVEVIQGKVAETGS